MKIKYIFIFTLCMFIKCEIVYAQQDSLNLVWKIIFKAENKDTLSYNDLTKLIYSYDNIEWKNNVELSEGRSDAINSLLLSSHNLNLLLEFMNNNPKYNNYILLDINPIYETCDRVYYYLKQQKGYHKLKSKIKDVLR